MTEVNIITKPDTNAALLLIINPKSQRMCLIPFNAWYDIPKTIKKTTTLTKVVSKIETKLL